MIVWVLLAGLSAVALLVGIGLYASAMAEEPRLPFEGQHRARNTEFGPSTEPRSALVLADKPADHLPRASVASAEPVSSGDAKGQQ